MNIKCPTCGREVRAGNACGYCGTRTVRKQWSSKHTILFLLPLALVLYIAFIFFLVRQPKDINRTTNRQSVPQIRARVSFDGQQFIIRNDNAFDWADDVEFTINGGLLSGYKLKPGRIIAGQTYKAGALQFADSNGVRFNPHQIKPQKFWISTNGGQGFYSADFQ